MGHGGARRGAGRKPGSKTKKTPQLLSDDIAIAADATVASDTIVDLMQKIAHDQTIDVQLRLDAAKAVAPYLRGRIGVRAPLPRNSVGRIASIEIVQFPAGMQLGPCGEVLTPEEAGPIWERFRATRRAVPLFTGNSTLMMDDDPVTVVDDDDEPDPAA